MVNGSKPTDGGNLLLSQAEKDELIRLECRVSTGWMSYNYFKSQYLLEGCKSEILEFLQPD